MAKHNNIAKSNDEEKLTKEQLKEQKKQEKQKLKAKKEKEKKERKPGLFKKLKDAWSELKKVTWASFPTVVKKTGVVILVVLMFTVVLFGIDYLLGLLYNVFLKA